jgi:uncharacterized membrane protein YdbT with pleckstrin-like domain
MSYIETSLSDGEKVVKLFRLHWTARLWLVLWIVLILPTFGIALLLAIYEWLRLRTLEYGVTNKRVIFKKGIIGRQTEEMKIGSIETVEIDQGVLGRILGYGDVKVTGRGISDVVFRRMDDPMAVKRYIEGVSHPAA